MPGLYLAFQHTPIQQICTSHQHTYMVLANVCRATGALALVKLAAPQPDELGFAKKLALEEIGGTNVVVLQQDASQGQVSFAIACCCLCSCARLTLATEHFCLC